MPSQLATEFVTSRALGMRRAAEKAGTTVRPAVLRTAEAVGQTAEAEAAAVRSLDEQAVGRGDALSLVAARRAIARGETPDVAAAGSDAALRAAPDAGTLGVEDGLDGFGLRPGSPGYAQAIATHSNIKRVLKESGEVVILEEPLQMLPMGTPQEAPAPSTPESPMPVSVAAASTGKRVIFSFGPQPGMVVVTVEDPVLDDALTSITVDIEAARAFKPVLALLGKCKDMTGGALNAPTGGGVGGGSVIELGPAASEPESVPEKPHGRKSA